MKTLEEQLIQKYPQIGELDCIASVQEKFFGIQDGGENEPAFICFL